MKKFTHKTAEKQGRMALRMRFMALLGLMFLFVAGMSLDAVAQKGNNMPTPVQKSCSLQRGNAQVNLTVKGQMPGTVKVQATPVQRSAVQGKQVKGAYDITLKDGNVKWQPQAGQPVMVTIADASFTDGEYLDVYHEGANGNEFVATVSPKNGQITFPARSFSVYIVTKAGDEARLKVKFYQNSQQVAADEPVEIYVKKKDIDNGHFNSVLYDPGVGTLEEGVTFLGWIKDNPNYTYDNVESDAKTIAGVRTEIQSKLEDGIQEGDEVAYYAMLFKTYIVSYYDGSPATLGSDNVTFRADAETTEYSYTISKTYVPTSSEYNFMGWVVKDETPSTAGNIVSDPPADGLYQYGDEITIKGNVNFSVDEEQGNWLVFDENGKGATYNAPQFVKNGDVTSDEDLLEMKRPGYEFDGWYTDQACTDGNEFDFGHELTERTTIYAKWTAHETAGYSVIVWMQKLTDQAVEGQPNSDYDFGQSFRVEDAQVGTQPTAVVGSTGATSITVDGNTVSEEGFHFKSTDQSSVTITPEGTSVVNVYMDRDVVTLKFHVWGYGDETYTATTSNSGTQYGLVDGEYVQLTRVTAYDGTFNDVYVWTYPTTTTTYTGTRYRYDGGLFGSGWTSGTGNDYNYGNINGGYMPLTRNGNTWSYSALPYTGTRYILSQGTGWGDYLTISGRYGSTLAENSVAWPEEYDWYETGGNNGNTSGTRTTFLDAFLPASTSTQVDFYGSTPEGNTHVYFYKQRPDRTGYDLANTVNTNATGFNLSDKYNGYKCTAWNSTNNTNTWQVVGAKMNQSGNWYYDANPNQNGYQTASISSTTGLHIYFDVETYELNFRSGSTYYGNNGTNPQTGAPTYGTYQETLSPDPLHTQSDVAYGANLDDYEDYEPEESTWPEGYVFDGWFADDGCTTPYIFSTMPANNVILYAKWRQIRFRVFLHPNAYIETEDGDLVKDQTLDWGSETQAMNFGVAWGDKVSAPTGRRDNYEFVGWFTDSEFQHPFDKDAIVMNNTNVPATPEYDKTQDMTDKMDKWGEITNEVTPYNSDFDRPWVQRKFDLYAQWRATVDGAIGIDVVYDDGDGDNAPTDQNHYLDAAVATAGAAATAPANKVFSHWVVQKYNCDEEQFEDTEITVYPGEKFTIHRNDALIEVSEWCDPLDDNPKVHPDARKVVEPTPCNNLTPPTETYEYVDPETGDVETRGYTKIYDAEYTIQLRAEYLAVELPQPTFIIWYNNYEDAEEEVLHQDGNTGQEGDTHEALIVNHAVTIPTPAPRSGYKFLGWFKQYVEAGEDVEPVIEIAEDADLFLYYNEEDGKYYKEATFENEATQVAADEADPYDYLYAAWEQTCVIPEVTVADVAVCPGNTATLEAEITDPQEGTTYTYQWYTVEDSQEPQIIENATEDNYATTTAGTYGVIVTNAGCVSEIVTATVTIYEELTATELTPAEYCLNDNPTPLTTTVSGGHGTTTYKWYKGNDVISSATTNSYTPSTEEAGTATYKVEATNDCGTVTKTATVTVYEELTATELTPAEYCLNDNPTALTTTVSGGHGTTTYKWYKGNDVISSATTNSYIPSTEEAGTVTYKVEATNECGTVTKTATVTVYEELTATELTPANYCFNDNPTALTTTVSGGHGTTTYKWYKGNDVISSATTNSYTPSTEEAGTVTYKVEATNDCGTVTKTATVTVYEELTATELTPAEYCLNDNPTALTTTVSGGHGTTTYKWYKDNDVISGATTNSYTPSTEEAGTVTYKVEATNECGTVTKTATVTVNALPVLTVGQLAQPTCTAKGQIPVTTTATKANYTYYLGTAEKATQAATSYTYTGLDAGQYTVKVVDGNGCASNEESVTLTLDQSEITFDPITMEVCSGYPFSETPDGADDEVTYTWAAPTCDAGIIDQAYKEEYATQPQGTIKGKLVNTGNATGHAVYTVYPHLGVCNLDPLTVFVEVDATVRPEVSLDIEATSPVCADQGTLEVTAKVTNSVTESGYTLTWNWQGQDEDQTVQTATATVTHEIAIPVVQEEKQFTLSLSYTDGVCTAETSTEITVQPLPTIKLTPATQTITYGDAIEDVVVTLNDYENYAILFEADQLPAGITYDQDAHKFSGTPKAVGTYIVEVTAEGHEGIACDPVSANCTIIVNKKNLIISLDSTKVYDGYKFDVTYQQLHVEGLVPGDHFTAGSLTTESADPTTPLSGIHVGEYTTQEGFELAPMAEDGYVVVDEAFALVNGDGDDVKANYTPAVDVTLKITLRKITITSATETRPYNGEPLTNHTVEVTSEETPAIAATDQLADGTPTVTGSQLCLGTSDNTMLEDAAIMQGDVDVTADYGITYQTGTLTVTEMDPANFVCPEPVEILLKDCEVERVVTNEELGQPTIDNVTEGHYVVTNNLDELNPMTFGTYTVVWTMIDDPECNNVVATCEQEVTIAYTPCGTMELGGYTYQTVRIGSQCWITENLRYETGTAVAYKEDDANVEKFGYLYTWYTAVGVAEDDDTAVPETKTDDCGNEYVQGICPDNWGVGSQADYDLLNSNAAVNLLKDPSTQYWQTGYEGDAEGNTGFSARGSGMYNSVKDRYEELMTNYHFWNADSTPGSAVNSEMISYYCDHIQTIMTRKSDKMSVRCVRKITPEQ